MKVVREGERLPELKIVALLAVWRALPAIASPDKRRLAICQRCLRSATELHSALTRNTAYTLF